MGFRGSRITRIAPTVTGDTTARQIEAMFARFGAFGPPDGAVNRPIASETTAVAQRPTAAGAAQIGRLDRRAEGTLPVGTIIEDWPITMHHSRPKVSRERYDAADSQHPAAVRPPTAVVLGTAAVGDEDGRRAGYGLVAVPAVRRRRRGGLSISHPTRVM